MTFEKLHKQYKLRFEQNVTFFKKNKTIYIYIYNF